MITERKDPGSGGTILLLALLWAAATLYLSLR